MGTAMSRPLWSPRDSVPSSGWKTTVFSGFEDRFLLCLFKVCMEPIMITMHSLANHISTRVQGFKDFNKGQTLVVR
jgi:hypothetical protein